MEMRKAGEGLGSEWETEGVAKVKGTALRTAVTAQLLHLASGVRARGRALPPVEALLVHESSLPPSRRVAVQTYKRQEHVAEKNQQTIEMRDPLLHLPFPISLVRLARRYGN